MTSEKKQEYTRRITNASKSGLVVIIYDMLLDYLEDAKNAVKQQDYEALSEAIERAQRCIREQIASLNFEYKPSSELFSLYVFMQKQLSRILIYREEKELVRIREMVIKLRDAYAKISEEDHSEPVMKNAQSIVMGLTYSRNQKLESLTTESGNRGFIV